jgi:hypothetical protein
MNDLMGMFAALYSHSLLWESCGSIYVTCMPEGANTFIKFIGSVGGIVLLKFTQNASGKMLITNAAPKDVVSSCSQQEVFIRTEKHHGKIYFLFCDVVIFKRLRHLFIHGCSLHSGGSCTQNMYKLVMRGLKTN